MGNYSFEKPNHKATQRMSSSPYHSTFSTPALFNTKNVMLMWDSTATVIMTRRKSPPKLQNFYWSKELQEDGVVTVVECWFTTVVQNQLNMLV